MKRGLILVAVALALPYACAPLYRFPAAAPFAGERFFNPYSTMPPAWQRANLHAHSSAWGGLTSGRQTAAQIVRRYRALGYAVPGVSNYQQIARPEGELTLPVYEHGLNLGKRHQLALGAASVTWFDFPLWQAASHQQRVIDRVAAASELVALAHPTSRGAYLRDDVRRLTGYQLVEIANGIHLAEGIWDAALSAGRPVWAIANDDTHDLDGDGRLATAWTMVGAATPSPRDVIDALRSGRSYAAIRFSRGPSLTDTGLERVTVEDGVLRVACTGDPATIVFLGQDGRVRRRHRRVTAAAYTFRDDDSYIRTVIEGPRTTIFLNPVVRYDGAALPRPRATVNNAATWLLRTAVLAGLAAAFVRRRRAAGAAIVIALSAAPSAAAAQPPDPYGVTAFPGAQAFDAALLRDLPVSDNLFALIETTVPPLISDRFAQGGLYAGEPSRLGGFLRSWTQTAFLVDGIDVTDPRGTGRPLLFPELWLWRRIAVSTGSDAPDANGNGATVRLDPLEPAASWRHEIRGAASHGSLTPGPPAATAPAIVRLDGFDRAGIASGGPLLAGRGSALLAASWTRGSRFVRAEAEPVDASLASAFGQLALRGAASDRFRVALWAERGEAPFDHRVPFARPDAATTHSAVHAHAIWERPNRPGWRLAGSFSRRREAIGGGLPEVVRFERLLDGPVSELVHSGPGLVRQWSVAGRLGRREPDARPADGGRLPAHAVSGGFDLGFSHFESPPWLSELVAAELVDGIPARLWQFSSPATDSIRRGSRVAIHVRDRIQLTRRIAVDAGLQLDAASASARGAVQGIGWTSLLPQVSFAWKSGARFRPTLFAGYSRTSRRLTLDLLAVGDPAAPRAEIFRWDPASDADGGALAERGPLIARAGPGSGGDPSFSRVAEDLSRPVADEIFVGGGLRPAATLNLLVAGFVRRERDLLALVDEGAPLSSYTVRELSDPGVDLIGPQDDQTLLVYERRTGSFGHDRYLLTNLPHHDADAAGLEISARLATRRVVLAGGATAAIAEGPAAHRGFGPVENDASRPGELFQTPNATAFARGRLFSDRAYTVKLLGSFALPHALRLGVVARYQDGQPFARMVVVPGLAQGADAVRAFANGGHRFTFTGTLDARLQRRFALGGTALDLYLDAYNLPALAHEVEERVVTGDRFRSVTAIQPSRALALGVRMAF